MQPLNIALLIANRELVNEAQACVRDLPVRVVLEQPDIGEWAALLDSLERLRPDLVLLEYGLLQDGLEEGIRKIRRTAGAPLVVAVHTANEPDTILRAIRAGAAEYLYPPMNPSLKTALQRIAGERAQIGATGSRAKTLGFFSAKGGCGATTVACHLAVEVQRQTSQKVLLADFDLATGIVGFLMKSKSHYSVVDAINNVQRLDPSYWNALISNGIPGLEVIAAPVTVYSEQPSDREHLRHVLQFARTQYDWVLVDLGRGLDPSTLTALEETEQAFLVSTLDVPALYQAKLIVRSLVESGYPRENIHLIVNRASRRTEVTTGELHQMLGVAVHTVLPDDSAALYDAYAAGKLLPAGSMLGKHFTTLARQITGARDEKKRKFSILG